jgi:predicted nucleic acid-binding protein
MMVVDGSVAVLWYVPQALSAVATELVTSGEELTAPSLVELEVAGVLLRSVRRGEMTTAEVDEVLLDTLPRTLRFRDEPGLTRDAVRLAARHGGALYDATYVALAVRAGTNLVSADAGQARVAEAAGVTVRLLQEPRRVD